MDQQPTWKSHKKAFKFEQLKQDLSCEILIVGAGLAGLLTAYDLARAGKKATVIDAGEIGNGATAYTTAMITNVVDTSLGKLIKMYGEDKARLVWQAGIEAINKLEQIVVREEIDCDFLRCPAYVYAADQKQIEDLSLEHEAATKLGFTTTLHKQIDLGINQFGAWEIPNQAKFHPLKFLFALAQKCQALGVTIYENTQATEIYDNDVIKVETKFSTITAQKMIMCTYRPFKNPVQTLFKKGMYLTYQLEAQIPKGKIPEAIFFDQNNPYYYFRIDPKPEFNSIIIGGEDHREEIPIEPKKSFASLEKYLQGLIPNTEYKIVRQWTGKILEPSDGLALIGEYKKNHLIATAFSGTGMIYSAIAGEINSSIVLSINNPYAHVFDPKRIPSIYQLFLKGKDYLEELAGGAGKNFFSKGKQQPQT